MGERMVAGLGGMNTGAVPSTSSYWFAFIEVDDVERRVEAALALGATLVRPIEEVPDIGRIAVIRDPTGAAIGWKTPAATSPTDSE